MMQCPDLSIDEIVTDPMIRAVMNADRVDSAAFEALLRRLASKSLAPGGRGRASEGCGRPAPDAPRSKTA